MADDNNFKQFRDEMALLGESVFTYNDLIEVASLMFSAIIGSESDTMRKVALSAWHALNSDRSQMMMLRAAAKTRFQSEEFAWQEAAKEIDWFCSKTIGFIDDRNNTVHSPLSLNIQDDIYVGLQPSTTMGHPRAKRLINKDIAEELSWQSEYATELKEFGLFLTLMLPRGSGPLQERPRLPSRGHKNTHPGQ